MDELRTFIDEVAVPLAYLAAAVMFIFGLKRLSSPATARSGNQIAAIGMAVALLVTFIHQGVVDYGWILAGMVIGAVPGFYLARTVAMTAMPQMVALFNGMGGGCAALISLAEFLTARAHGTIEPWHVLLSSLLSLVIGSVSLTGSLIAFGKLQGLVPGKPVVYPGYRIVNGIIALLIVAGGAYMFFDPTNTVVFVAVMALALVLGVAIVMPIGGADMPVVIALLNSFTGTAAAMTGFVLNNSVLIISGALVGASGMFLTLLMAKAMNRSVANVFFGAFGTEGAVVGGEASELGTMRETSVEDAATMMAYARNVIVVPGYGLAVAQAQHAVRDLAAVLEGRGVNVRYAIHPVAGRMPGHMNVLLAEANVPYDDLFEMEQINDSFDDTDVALVVGANDVTNPAARNNPQSPIYGMPILNVDHAHNIIVIKRGRGAGFAGIENELFYDAKTQMLFMDAKSALTKLVEAAKTV
jgi:NAD(P) transhydrogenase subunit beta